MKAMALVRKGGLIELIISLHSHTANVNVAEETGLALAFLKKRRGHRPGVSIPEDQGISGHLTEPSCQQEEHEMTEVAAAVFPDLAVQVPDEPLHYRLLEVAKSGRRVCNRPCVLGPFHRLFLLSASALSCLTEIYTRKGPMTIRAGCG